MTKQEALQKIESTFKPGWIHPKVIEEVNYCIEKRSGRIPCEIDIWGRINPVNVDISINVIDLLDRAGLEHETKDGIIQVLNLE